MNDMHNTQQASDILLGIYNKLNGYGELRKPLTTKEMQTLYEVAVEIKEREGYK